jgi:chorismate mutase
LKKIFEDLKVKKITVEEDDFNTEMIKLRANIDIADSKLLEILGNRMKVAEQIGALKKAKNVAVLQNKRWNEILGKMILDGDERGLSEEFILKIFKAIHQESIAHQEKIINS